MVNIDKGILMRNTAVCRMAGALNVAVYRPSLEGLNKSRVQCFQIYYLVRLPDWYFGSSGLL